MRNKYAIGGALLICTVIVGLMIFSGGTTFAEKAHSLSHTAGLCEGESCDAVTATISNMDGCSTDGAGCAPSVSVAVVENLSAEEKKVVAYIADQVATEGRTQFEDGEIEKAAGISAKTLDNARLQSAVMAELSRRNFNFAQLAGAGNCATFSACSIDRNLNGASGEELASYQAEKAEDGKNYTDLQAAAFSLPMTDGKQVSLTDFDDKPVVLVTLSVHCYHSMETLPVLAKLKKKYEARGLSILPVFVNATSVEDIQSTIEGLDLDYPVAVAEGKTLSESYKSRMVPSTFLVDSRGNITKKLVGQKDESTLDRAFGELLEASTPALGMLNR